MDSRSSKSNNQTNDQVYGEVLQSDIRKEESNENKSGAQFQEEHENETLHTMKVMSEKYIFCPIILSLNIS